MNEILSIGQVADLLDCTMSTVAERTLAGDLPAVKFGRSWRYPREALMRRLNELALSRTVALPAALAVSVPQPNARRRRLLPVLPDLNS